MTQNVDIDRIKTNRPVQRRGRPTLTRVGQHTVTLICGSRAVVCNPSTSVQKLSTVTSSHRMETGRPTSTQSRGKETASEPTLPQAGPAVPSLARLPPLPVSSATFSLHASANEMDFIKINAALATQAEAQRVALASHVSELWVTVQSRGRVLHVSLSPRAAG